MAKDPARLTGGAWRRSLGAGLAAARPDQRVAGPVFGVEQVRVDRLGEGGIVELDREVVAALVRALRPGGADLGLTDEHAVGRGVVVGAVGLPLALSAPRSVSAALDGLQHFPPVSARRGVAADLGGVAPGPARTTGPRGQPNRRHHR